MQNSAGLCENVMQYNGVIMVIIPVIMWHGQLTRPRYEIVIKEVLHLLPPKGQKLACFVLYLKMINIFLKK